MRIYKDSDEGGNIQTTSTQTQYLLPQDSHEQESAQIKEKIKQIIKENKKLEKYYKDLYLLPEEEYNCMMNAFRTDLPVTFRTIGVGKFGKETKKLLEEKYFPELRNIEINGKRIEIPKKVEFYPDDLAWMMSISNNELKKNEKFNKFNEFLKREIEFGNMIRQDVSSMIPALLLNVEPHHFVLDLCCSTGTKSLQLIDALHKNNLVPEGVIIANDSENKNFITAGHRMKSIQSPNLLVTKNKAKAFPNLTINGKDTKYDRILCNVPCSEDGKLREKIAVWRQWNKTKGYRWHKEQLDIAIRGVQLLKVGGIMVYSTNSINPVENEAVVANLLNKFNGKIVLKDVSNQLPGFITAPAVKNWKVYSYEDKHIESYDAYLALEVRFQKEMKWIIPTLFPPNNIDKLGLEKCIRIYPHLQNTGGSFIAVFEKVQNFTKEEAKQQEFDEEKEKERQKLKESYKYKEREFITKEEKKKLKEEKKNKKKSKREIREEKEERLNKWKPKNKNMAPMERFISMKLNSPQIGNIKETLDLNKFPIESLVVPTNREYNGFIFYVAPSLKKILESDQFNELDINYFSFTKAFYRSSKRNINSYRVHSDALDVFIPYFYPTLLININKKDLKLFLSNSDINNSQLSESVKNKLVNIMDRASIIFTYSPRNDMVFQSEPDVPDILVPLDESDSYSFPAWKDGETIRLSLSKQVLCFIKERYFDIKTIWPDRSEDLEKKFEKRKLLKKDEKAKKISRRKLLKKERVQLPRRQYFKKDERIEAQKREFLKKFGWAPWNTNMSKPL